MLPAEPSPLQLARTLAAGRGLVFLDSADGTARSRVFHDPLAVLTTRGTVGTLTWNHGRTESLSADPFRWLDAFLRSRPELTAAGYWGYDLRHLLERLPNTTHDDLHLPDSYIGLYPPNHIHDFSPVLPIGRCPGTPARPHANGLHQPVSRPAYEAAVRRVLQYIAAGDCYQVNLSHRLSTPLNDAPWSVYQRLRAASPAPYAAYLDCGDHHVLSSSPELFLRIRGREVETRPIKGTRPRGTTPEEDAARAAELLSSAKDRAELLMIVDLERNDLGRVCEYGTIHVPELFRLETYANVHHLVATVCGTLRPEIGPLECLRAAFPGGSITGAPKIRAMEIIEELEPVRRGVYTGAIGWVDGQGNAEWNIAIRTLVAVGGQVYFHVGGGIVADSDPAAEYRETLDKARGMLRALGF